MHFIVCIIRIYVCKGKFARSFLTAADVMRSIYSKTSSHFLKVLYPLATLAIIYPFVNFYMCVCVCMCLFSHQTQNQNTSFSDKIPFFFLVVDDGGINKKLVCLYLCTAPSHHYFWQRKNKAFKVRT